MPPRKKSEGSSATSTVVKHIPNTSQSTSQLPDSLRFPLVVVLNLSLSSILYTISAEFFTGDLAEVSRRHDEWWEIGALLGVKFAELAVSWYGGYDSYDLASLTLITHFPVLYLLTTFYEVSTTTLLASLAIDIFSIALPVHLLRPLSASHSLNTHPKNSVANRLILADPVTQLATSLAATGVYSVVLLLAYKTTLPASLAAYFSGLRTLEPVHSLPFYVLFAWLVPLGFAAKTFLFVPATGAKPDGTDAQRRHFRPATASLQETILYNFWGWKRSERELLTRTGVMAAMTGLYVATRTVATVEGSEVIGALSWAGVWSAAAVAVGGAFWWVGQVEEVKA